MIDYVRTYLRLNRDERAVTAVEYALIAGLIAVVIIGAVTTLGTNISTVFSRVGTDISTVA